VFHTPISVSPSPWIFICICFLLLLNKPLWGYVYSCIRNRHTFFFLFLAVLGFELRNLYLLGHAPSPLWLELFWVIFQLGSGVFAWVWSQPSILLLTPSHTWFTGWDRISLTFCLCCLQTLILLMFSSWNYRCEPPLSAQAGLELSILLPRLPSSGITSIYHYAWP
jgi:hypothetical protein